MSDPVIINDVLVKNRVEKSKDPTNGLVTTTTYKGSKEKVQEQFNRMASQAIESTPTRSNLKAGWGDGSIPALQVTNTQNAEGDGILEVYWEIDGNIVEDQVENNAYWTKTPAIDVTQQIKVLSDYRKGTVKMDPTIEDTKAKELWVLLTTTGTDVVKTFNVVLRKNQICASGSDVGPAMDHVFEVQDLDVIDPPAKMKTPLDTLGHEWLKQAPRIRQLSKISYQISTEWWSNEKWIGAFYKNGTGIPTG